MAPSTTPHARQQLRSYHNLSRARKAAFETSKYDSNTTRSTITSVFRERFGSLPRPWQLDVGEALHLGLDCIVIAGTGSGKTMPFMMPSLLDESKKVIVISPLKILQADQVERFKKMKLTAAAVNGETWNSSLKKDLEDGCFQGVFTSPEMCLKHSEFRHLLTSTSFRDIAAVIVNEAHCIAQWGGEFRTAYSEIGKLRAFFPAHIPILATSATLPSRTLQEVRSSLGIDADESFYLNLGNDRPNIAFSVRKMQSANDHEAIRPLLSRKPDPTTTDDLYKSVVFVNEVPSCQITAREVRSWLPPHLHKYVDCIHSRRSPAARRQVMERFRKGKIKILIATEAAGMGADIPDVEQVIQFGVPSSLSVWMQRAGRAGHDPTIKARVVLLVEKSMFQRQKQKNRNKTKTKKKRTTTTDSSGSDSDRDVGGDGEHDESVVENRVGVEVATQDSSCRAVDGGGQGQSTETLEGMDLVATGLEWRKKVDEDLRRWIETEVCRRDVADEYFGNPPERQVPTGICCDNCSGNWPNLFGGLAASTLEERPSTPTTSDSGFSSQHSTPSRSTNDNGKRPMVTELPSVRRGPILQNARDALLKWRNQTKRDMYSPSSVTAACLLPDNTLKMLASSRELLTVEAIQAKTKWIFALRHGPDILRVLQGVDQAILDKHEADKQAKAAAAVAAAEKKRAERQRRDDLNKQCQEQKLPSRRLRSSVPEGCSVFSYMPVQPSALTGASPLTVTSTPTLFSTPTGGVLDFRISQTPDSQPSIVYSLPPPPTPLGSVTNWLTTPVNPPQPRPRPRPRPLPRPSPAVISGDSENVQPVMQLSGLPIPQLPPA